GHDQRDVLVERGLEHHPTEARISKHALHDDDARHQIIDLQQNDGDRIDHGIAQCVTEHDLTKAHALEDCGADIGSAHHLDHGGAHHTDHVTHIEQHNDSNREHHLGANRPASTSLQCGGSRQPAERHHEDVDEKDAEREFGYRSEDRAAEYDAAVEQATLAHARSNAKRHGQWHDEEEGDQSQQGGVLQPV